jgi:NADH-quinone oxidoreductase subunit L
MIFPYYPVFILLAPLAAGLIIGLLGSAFGQKVGRVGVAAEVIAFALSLLLLYDVTGNGPQTFYLSGWSDGILQFGLYIDRLSAVMLVHIAAISILIHLFSIRYMQQERGYTRFHSLLAFTTFALFGMVSSPNLLMLFVFWQLLSWFVPLLSYNYSHPPTVRGAFRTFIMHRFGDVAFLAAVVLAYSFYGTLDFRQLFVRAAEVQTLLALWPGGDLDMHAGTVVTLLIFIGAMSKSAQFPLHVWLPDSLYAPTPVSALFHAGIINAGGFLLSRLAPLYALSPSVMHLVFAVGMLTALLGSSMMLVQNDIKKTLGYSTVGQMGFMIMECGLGAYGLAIFHLIAHGLFKGTAFLNSGYVIHAARQEPRRPSKERAADSAEFSKLTWLTGFITTLILPLIILLAAHGVLNIPLLDSQGTTIFLFFGWATSSQAILTLYRLKAAASWKVAVAMLCTLSFVVVTYLFAAESFSHFLFPAPGEVTSHFNAGALPVVAFDLLVVAFALVIVVGWILIYATSHGKTYHTPRWVGALQVRLYLLLINRLYIDTLSLRLRELFSGVIGRANGSPAFSYGCAAMAVILTFFAAKEIPELTLLQATQAILVALALPLFPLHGVYVAAVSRAPGCLPVAFAVVLPAAGLYGLADLTRSLPAENFRIVSALAMVGALYGSFKALAQLEIGRLLAYAGVALYSVLWWNIAMEAKFAVPAAVYVAAASLLSAGLLLAWLRLRRRYGDLTLDRAHGLARPMPRFAVVLSLLIMAAIGLPPFGLFSGHVELLLRPALAFSWELGAILITWFLASWYLFRMMQRLLFGPHRSDLRYDDLRANEVAYFAALLALLIFLGATPPALLQSSLLPDGRRAAMEILLWLR